MKSYIKPTIVSSGKASRLIQGSLNKQGPGVDSIQQQSTSPGYEADE